MDNFDKQISKKVKSFLEGNVEFKNEEKNKILENVESSKHKSKKFYPIYWTVLGSAVILFFILSLPFIIFENMNFQDEKLTGADVDHQYGANSNWEESPLFETGSYTMIGEEGRLGFIYDDSEVTRFYPNKVQKYMWHFWGEEEEFTGDLKVVATHEGNEKQIILLEGKELSSSAYNGADHVVPSNMSLPKSGMWKLNAYIGGKQFGTIFLKVYSWEVRTQFVKGGEVLLRVAPDPALVAGKSFGYLFHFTEPFETFKGKELTIYAYHKETGERITAVSSEIIKKPTSGYSSLQRYTATFKIPVGGIWRYEVLLDNKAYADVVLSVKE